MRTLVVGCDASGKSTALSRLHESFGDPIIESTSTAEARKFKHDNLVALIDTELIAKREELYLELTRQTLAKLSLDGVNTFIGTDATLVTRLSHSVMRQCIGASSVCPEDIIDKWIQDEQDCGSELPDAIVLTHAPFSVISERIHSRQKSGMQDEKFWGFNSQFFLNHYQENWKKTLPHLAQAGFACISYDTSSIEWEDFYKDYSALRK